MGSPAVADLNKRGSPTAAPDPPKLTDRIRDLETETKAVEVQVKDATAHACETVRQAENLHMSHPTLYQRAHGATIANEPPGVHHLHWLERSLVRDRQHKDELAVGKLKGLYSVLVTKSLAIRGHVIPQDKATVKMINAAEEPIARMRVDLELLQGIVSSR